MAHFRSVIRYNCELNAKWYGQGFSSAENINSIMLHSTFDRHAAWLCQHGCDSG